MSPQFSEQNSILCLAQAAQSDMTANAGSALSCGGHGRQEGRAAQKEPWSRLILFSKLRNSMAYIVLKVVMFGRNIFALYLLPQSP